MVGVSQSRRASISSALFNLFIEVTSEASQDPDFIIPYIEWYAGALADYELQVAIVTKAKSLVAKAFKGAKLGDGGTTHIGGSSGNLSEVYWDVWGEESALCVAKIMFHEPMHNKLQQNDSMHSDPDAGFGLASGPSSTGCSDAPWDPFHLSQGNITAMANVLLDPAPQFMIKP